MKLITKNSDYAIRALCAMIQGKRFIATSSIARKEKIPLPYLHRIIDRLIKEDIVESKEGKNGGVRLKKNPSKINLAYIIRLFQGEIQISQCMFRKNSCPNIDVCVLRKRIKKIEKLLINELSKITIESLNKTRGGNE